VVSILSIQRDKVDLLGKVGRYAHVAIQSSIGSLAPPIERISPSLNHSAEQ